MKKLLLFLSATVCCSFAYGQIALDQTFGTEGKILNYFGGNNQMADMILLPDGKIVAVGAKNSAAPDTQFLVVRHLADGSLDPGFGDQGMVATNAGDYSRATSAAIQSDGKLLVAGHTHNPANLMYSDVMVARYLDNGTLDPDFGTGGIFTVEHLRSDLTDAILLQPDGKILLGGISGSSLGSPLTVLRLNTDGSIDTTFGDLGYALINIGYQCEINDIQFLSDGSIFGVGLSHGQFMMVKFTAQGVPAPGFGDNGVVTLANQTGDMDQLLRVIVLPGDQMIAVGSTFNNGKMKAVLVKFDADGNLVAGFGDQGKLVKDFGVNINARALQAALDADGNLIVGLSVGPTNNYDFVAGSFNPDTAEVNTNFGDNGFFTVVFGDGHDYLENLLIQPDGKILMGGSKGGFCAARLVDTALKADTFENLQTDMRIHPNPITEDAFLTLNLTSPHIIEATLFDMRGVSYGTVVKSKPIPKGQTKVALGGIL